jgi:hypothetical protein
MMEGRADPGLGFGKDGLTLAGLQNSHIDLTLIKPVSGFQFSVFGKVKSKKPLLLTANCLPLTAH